MTTVGGLTEAKRLVELAVPRGILGCPGNWGTQDLGAASVHLAAVSPNTPFVECGAAQVFWSPLRKAIQQVGLPIRDGAIALPMAPGIGVDLPEDLIAHFRLDVGQSTVGGGRILGKSRKPYRAAARRRSGVSRSGPNPLTFLLQTLTTSEFARITLYVFVRQIEWPERR